jgi:hypothetical protein
MSSAARPIERGCRIDANCKKVWGANKEFDLSIETDDYEHYACYVKEDVGDSFSGVLVMTALHYGEERAWQELDKMLAAMARKVDALTDEERAMRHAQPAPEPFDLNKAIEQVRKIDESIAKSSGAKRAW